MFFHLNIQNLTVDLKISSKESLTNIEEVLRLIWILCLTASYFIFILMTLIILSEILENQQMKSNSKKLLKTLLFMSLERELMLIINSLWEILEI